MSVNNRSLFMFLVFMAILLPLYGCGGGDSEGETGTPLASQPSIIEYSPSGSTSSCSAPSLLTDYTRLVVFIDETGNREGSYTFCLLSSGFSPSTPNSNTVLAQCGSLHELANRSLLLDIGAGSLSANVAEIFGTGTGWDGRKWAVFSPSRGTIRLTDGRSRLRIENYRITPSSGVDSLWFDGGCYNPFSGMENLRSAILTENADNEETPLSETLSAMGEFLSNYDPDNSDVDEDFDDLKTSLERLETNGSEIEE